MTATYWFSSFFLLFKMGKILFNCRAACSALIHLPCCLSLSWNRLWSLSSLCTHRHRQVTLSVAPNIISNVSLLPHWQLPCFPSDPLAFAVTLFSLASPHTCSHMLHTALFFKGASLQGGLSWSYSGKSKEKWQRYHGYICVQVQVEPVHGWRAGSISVNQDFLLLTTALIFWNCESCKAPLVSQNKTMELEMSIIGPL